MILKSNQLGSEDQPSKKLNGLCSTEKLNWNKEDGMRNQVRNDSSSQESDKAMLALCVCSF